MKAIKTLTSPSSFPSVILNPLLLTLEAYMRSRLVDRSVLDMRRSMMIFDYPQFVKDTRLLMTVNLWKKSKGRIHIERMVLPQ